MSFIRGYYRLSLAGLILTVCAVFIILTSYLRISIKKIPLSLRITQLLATILLAILNVRVICPEKETFRHFNGFFFPNHVSYLEVVAIFSVMPTRFLAKAAVRKLPLVGAIAAAVGCVFVQRGNKESRKEARRALMQVDTFPPITIFPEGKRGPGNALLPFRYGAFEIVAQGNSAFLPIAVKFNHLEIAIWHRQESIINAVWRLASQPEKIEVTLLPQEAVHPSPKDDPIALAKKIQAQLTAVLYPNATNANASTG